MQSDHIDPEDPTAPAVRASAKDIFLELVDLPDEERERALAELEEREPAVHARVCELLSADGRARVLSDQVAELLEGQREPASASGLPVVIGDYELTEEIASGGMGVVYRARQISLGRTVAVKLLRSGRLASEREIERFRAEAEAAARLDHPHIVPIYEVGDYEGRHYISMRLIEGESLDACLQAYQGDHRASAALIARTARAVHHGHRRGVLHRDLKPSNVLLDRNGTPHVADFGTAKLVDGSGQRTLTGFICGTPAYMAPEQAAADVEVTVATDVYALGCMLYELLTGSPPLVADGLIEQLRKVQEEVPVAARVRNPVVHRDLDTICSVCLAKDPTRRYDSGLALAEDLERWLAFEPIQARPATLTERAWLAWRRRPLVSGLVAAVALLITILAVGATLVSIELKDRLDQVSAAEQESRVQLRGAYLAQARAARHTGEIGQRAVGAEYVRLAAQIQPGTDLISEAAACMAQTDLEVVAEWSKPESVNADHASVFDPALERFVSVEDDGTLIFSSAEDGEELFRLEGPGSPAWRLAFSGDGRYLALVHHDIAGRGLRRMRIWDVERRELVREEERLPAGRMAWRGDCHTLLVPRAKGVVELLDACNGAVQPLWQSEGTNRILVLDPSGERVAATVASEGRIEIRSTATGQLLQAIQDEPHRHGKPGWSPDGKLLVAPSYDFNAYVWNVERNERIATLRGHTAEVVEAHSLRDGLVLTASWDGTSRVWDVRSGEQLVLARATPLEVSSSRDRVGFVTRGKFGEWKLLHEDVLRTLRAHTGKSPNTLAMSPNDRHLVSGGRESVVLWDFASGAKLDLLERDDVRSLVFAASGASVFVASDAGLERVPVVGGAFDVDGIEVLDAETRHSFAKSRDDSVMATLGRELRVWFPDAPEQNYSVPLGRGMRAVQVSPGGEWIASGSWRGSGVHIWRARDGKEVAHLFPELNNVAVNFSNDDRSVLCADQGIYRLLEVGTWREVRATERPYAGISAFSHDGERAAVRSGLWELELIDVDTGESIVVLESPRPQHLRTSIFSHDGRSLISGTAANLIQIWDLEALGERLRASGMGHVWPVPETDDIRTNPE
ncbi:MAG: protein kinase [bacterium]|nr:protein kinase [bacterium]